jgi:hypothetical protein
MSNKFLCINLAYQATKNMKYLGPKGAISVKHKNTSRPLIMHSINSINNAFPESEIDHKVVVGFESDKVLKSIEDNAITYSIVLDHKNMNHGKILKDILLKYDKQKYSGCIINCDIGFILQSKFDIDPNNNYIFYTNSNPSETENTCNIDGNKVEYIMYNTTDNYWTGLCFLSNDIIRLIKHINLVYFTDPLFLLEIINKTINSGGKFNPYRLDNKDYTYIKNTTLKKTKAV